MGFPDETAGGTLAWVRLQGHGKVVVVAVAVMKAWEEVGGEGVGRRCGKEVWRGGVGRRCGEEVWGGGMGRRCGRKHGEKAWEKAQGGGVGRRHRGRQGVWEAQENMWEVEENV
jgi:hypothetical protein